jgi:4-hydroxy-tetrahydrodipicolinate synthase
MITPFHEDLTIDYAAAAAQIERLIALGVGGILFLGSIGEFFSLTLAERREFLRFAIRQTAGRVRVMVGTGDTVFAHTLELMENARAWGADAAVLVSPYYIGGDQDCVYEYYAAVEKAGGLPIILYNFPDRTGVSIAPETVERLSRLPGIVGIKDTVDNISHTRALFSAILPARPDFEIYSGYDEYALINLLGGGSGVISGMNNLAPEVFRALLDAYETRDFDLAERMQRRVNAMMPLYAMSTPFIQAIKVAVSRLIDGMSPAMRPPCIPLTAAAEEVIHHFVDRMVVGGDAHGADRSV